MKRITVLNQPRFDVRSPLEGCNSPGRPVWAAAIFATATLVASPTLVLAQAGRLDPTFGNAGKAITPVVGTSSVANAIALQHDGKIILAGGLGTNQDFGLARYNPNGSLDQGFGAHGIALANIPNGILSVAIGVGVQSDGRIITGGTIYTLNSSPTGAQVFIGLGLVRFNANGSVDASFGNGGIVTTVPFNASQCTATAFALQADGKILLAGGCITGSGPTATTFPAIATRPMARRTQALGPTVSASSPKCPQRLQFNPMARSWSPVLGLFRATTQTAASTRVSESSVR